MSVCLTDREYLLECSVGAYGVIDHPRVVTDVFDVWLNREGVG